MIRWIGKTRFSYFDLVAVAVIAELWVAEQYPAALLLTVTGVLVSIALSIHAEK